MDITLKNISKAYGENIVLNNLSLNFLDGNSYCIMANSGFGKTTLLNIIMGIVKQDSGEVLGVSHNISAIFQENRLCESLTVGANIKVITSKNTMVSSIKQILNELGLSECYNKQVKDLSGGMKRRVAIARALVKDADLFIMDEPFNGLDLATKQVVMSYVKKITANKTVIWVTHDEREYEFFGGNIIKFNSF